VNFTVVGLLHVLKMDNFFDPLLPISQYSRLQLLGQRLAFVCSKQGMPTKLPFYGKLGIGIVTDSLKSFSLVL